MKVHEFIHEMQTTSAILGRTSGISVVFEGNEAKTDGKTIYLPALPQQADLTREQVLAMRGYVDHEAGHNRHSDMPRIMSFYDKNMNNDREDLNGLHNSLEDNFMEQKVIEEYPGAGKNLRQGHDLMRRREWQNVEKMGVDGAKELLASDPNTATGLAITTAKGELFNTEANQKMRSLLKPETAAMGEYYAKRALECENSNEVIELAKKIYQYNDKEGQEDQTPEGFEQMEAGGALDDLAGEDNEGENSEGFDPGKAEKEARQGKGKGKGKSDDPIQSDDMGEILTMDDEYGPGGGGIGSCMDNGLRGGYRVYTTKADVVYKRGQRQGSKGDAYVWDVVNDKHNSFADYDKRKTNLRSDTMVMKNKLRRALLARQQRDWDFAREMGRLDSKRLVAAANGVRTVYKRRTDREDHDTAITILIDLSGSMYGEKAGVARDCAMALSECFEGTQMSYRISGFSNNGGSYGYRGSSSSGKFHRYERLDHVIFKDFDDQLRTHRGTIVRIPEAIGGNNSDYDFVDAELFTLSRRSEARKVLFVLSDGHVACYSDAPNSEHERLIKENLKHYKSRYGVESVGVGIMSSAVKSIYPDNVVVQDVGELSGAAFNMLTNILFREQRSHG